MAKTFPRIFNLQWESFYLKASGPNEDLVKTFPGIFNLIQSSVGKLLIKSFLRLLGPSEDVAKTFPGIFNLQSSVGKLLSTSCYKVVGPLKIWLNFRDLRDMVSDCFLLLVVLVLLVFLVLFSFHWFLWFWLKFSLIQNCSTNPSESYPTFERFEKV